MMVVGTTVHQTKKVQSVKVQRGIELQQSKDTSWKFKALETRPLRTQLTERKNNDCGNE